MQDNSPIIETIDKAAQLGKPLAPWTYLNEELFDLEYEAFFLMRWQFVGHVNDVPEVGDYIADFRDGLQEMPPMPAELQSGDPIDSDLWPRIVG